MNIVISIKFINQVILIMHIFPWFQGRERFGTGPLRGILSYCYNSRFR